MQLEQKALIEEAVQASIDAGLAVNGEHGVAAARHAARFMFNALQAVQPVPVVTGSEYVTRDSVVEALSYLEQYNGAGRKLDAYAMLVNAPTATASAEPVAIPDGWKLVPVKPTNEMVSAVRDIAGAQAAAYGLAAWDTMLKAAPVSGADNAK